MSWGVCDRTDDGMVHIYPLWGAEHDIDHGLACWCSPYRDDTDGLLIVHNEPRPS